MTPELDRLLLHLEPPTEGNLQDRLAFGLLCVERVSHLLEQPEAVDCLQQLRDQVANAARRAYLPSLVARASELAHGHPASRSLDGVGHAAVSATYACAKALAGRARQAAEYAAYAAVYGQGGYGATSDPSSFVPEFVWQAQQLRTLIAPGLARGVQGAASQAAPSDQHSESGSMSVTLRQLGTSRGRMRNAAGHERLTDGRATRGTGGPGSLPGTKLSLLRSASSVRRSTRGRLKCYI